MKKKVVISERKVEERKKRSFLYQFLIRTERERQDAVLWHDISMQDAEERIVLYIKKSRASWLSSLAIASHSYCHYEGNIHRFCLSDQFSPSGSAFNIASL